MRMRAALVVAICMVASATTAQIGPREIQHLLTSTPEWTVLGEYTQSELPSDRANRFSFAFFQRDGKLVGRTTNHAGEFNCEFAVDLRDSGFDFARCGLPPDAPKTNIDYFPQDRHYPFKRLSAPQKWWFTPAR